MTQHMVIFQNAEGDPGYNQFESIDDAIRFVEQLRNDQGIDSIRIFELEEVKFDLKPYYRVELQALTAGSSSTSGAASYGSTQPAPAPQGVRSSPEPAPGPGPAASAPVSEAAPQSSFAPPSEPAPMPSAPAQPSSTQGAAPTPPADQPVDSEQPARRGLFGR